MITDHEKIIITNAANNAQCFGTGILTSCQEQLEDYGYAWTDAHEKYVFDNFVNGES